MCILRFTRLFRLEKCCKFLKKAFFKIRHFSSGPVLLDEADIVYRAFKVQKSKGIMIDVGAHFGGTLARFAKCGWMIYAFEPDEQNRSVLSKTYGHCKNVIIDKRAVTDLIQDSVPFFYSDQSTGISGLSAFHTSHKLKGNVTTTTLSDYIIKNCIDKVTFLKIDTEGFDLHVLRGFPWERLEPEAIVCEFENSKTKPLGYTYHDMAEYIVNKGYEVFVSEWFPITKYGIAHKWRGFYKYPCELHDDKAWGNLIAVREQNLYDSICKIMHRMQKSFIAS